MFYCPKYVFTLSISGAIDPSLLLEQIEAYISTVKEEAFSRKDILERVEKWLNAREEEAWLEDYNKVLSYQNNLYEKIFFPHLLLIAVSAWHDQDDNRYNAGRGAHIMLKRAEKARVLVSKIPGDNQLLNTMLCFHS